MKIKICGLKQKEDIQIATQPDYVGFVFAPSKRQINLETAKQIQAELAPEVQSIGVFVNEKIETIIKIAPHINIIQLHGDEDEAYITELKTKIKNPIIKAVRVQTTEQIQAADKLPVDYLLLDTYSPTEYGGIGKTFDYKLIPPMQHKYFLAGGINIENINEALATNAHAIDISSGVETNGRKDPTKIIEIINKVKNTKHYEQETIYERKI